MGYSKITALSMTDLFVQQIENMILSGELAIGEQLPPARELAVKMGVSRTVVTAGLVELEKLGFVEIKPRQGVYVCDYRRRGTMETLVAIMRYNGGALRKNEVRSLLETRDAMESMCMRLVVECADTAALEALAPILESIRASRDNDEAAENIFLFHHEPAVHGAAERGRGNGREPDARMHPARHRRAAALRRVRGAAEVQKIFTHGRELFRARGCLLGRSAG